MRRKKIINCIKKIIVKALHDFESFLGFSQFIKKKLKGKVNNNKKKHYNVKFA